MNHCPNPDVDRDPARLERGRLPESLELSAVSVDTTALELFRRIAAALEPAHVGGDDGVRRAGGDHARSVPGEESER
ncbi:hypothetical protein [Streptomyces sp. NPDC059861]|uniref:hypothetical protein n=1 Tax=Streptomyces sp. NPDC059861 TaxID=3346974 RepID=UPI003649D589